MYRPPPRNISPAFLVIAGVTIAAFVGAGPVAAQVASSLLNEGDPFPDGGAGHIVNSLSNSAVNHAGGYAVSMNSTDGSTTISHIWGNATGGAGAIIRSEGTFGPLVQTSFESFYGMDDAGSVAYSASGTGGPVGSFDSVWKDDTPIVVEGEIYPHATNTWWSFGSRPGITADGTPYWVGGITNTQGGSTQNRGLFFGTTALPVLLGGDVVPDLPAPLNTTSTVSFDYRYSAFASSYLAEVAMVGSTSADAAMVLGGSGLILGGTLVREGNLVPASVGGIGGEAWSAFDFVGITEAGDYFFSGDTNGDVATDEFILKNGVILVREGDVVDGETVSGALEGGYMNEDGDIAYIWDIQNNSLEALFLNQSLLLAEGDEVDLDGDGFVDAGAVLASFTGISSLTASDRDVDGNVRLYFTADIDTAGTSSTTDDIEGFYCLEAPAQPTGAPLAAWETRVRLAQNRPNPFEGRTEIRFTLTRDSSARLTVFDVAGRRIATLVDGQLPAGEHSYWWRGVSGRDRRSAGGVYFYRLETNGGSETRKMVHVRRD